MDGIELIGGFFEFIGGFIDLIGPSAFFLMIVTMILLWIVNMVSPLSKVANYSAVIVLVAGFSLTGGIAIFSVLNYVAVMMVPLAAAQGVALLWRVIRFRIPGRRRADRVSRAADLSAQLNAQIRALR